MSDNNTFSRYMNLTTLQLFVAVCESGSIGQAAEREFIAASAVSKRLSDLEAAVGVPLLERHSRGVKPTSAGENLLQHARSILFDIQRLQTDLHEYAEGVRGHVRILANLSSIVQFLPEDLGTFAQEQPGIKIDLQERMSSDTLTSILEGAADLGIGHTPGAAPSGLQAKPYHQDQLVIVMPEGHPLARAAQGGSISFAQTLDCDFVGLHSASSIGLLLRQAAAASGLAVRQRIQVSGLDTMCRMIDNGLGIGVMPNRAFALMQPLGRLRAITLNDAWAHRQSWILARDFSTLSNSAKLLISHLEARVALRNSALPPAVAANGATNAVSSSPTSALL